MKLFVAVTDYEWYSLHASRASAEVNFWRPSPDASFKALAMGEPLLFKLHAPRNYIAGGGFFTKFVQLPVSLAWDAFREGNGAASIEEMRDRIAKYRKGGIGPYEDPVIGCILLAEPFFFPESDWIPAAGYFPPHTQVGKGYDADSDIGRALWREVINRLDTSSVAESNPGPAVEAARYGSATLVMPRLGQGMFRILVTDAYGRTCAITHEKALPVLEAAHIRPYARGGSHALSNGLLLRSDLHKLFDMGYVTVDPDKTTIEVSRRLKDEFDNGEEYYRLRGRSIRLPEDPRAAPARDNLLYHAQHVFR